jgi:hypothetical protein
MVVPPSSRVSPYDPTARYARRGQTTRWKGFLVERIPRPPHGDLLVRGANVITDVATTATTTNDTQALPGIHSRVKRRDLLPPEHLVDGGYPPSSTSTTPPGNQVTVTGPQPGNPTHQHRCDDGCDRDAVHIDFDRQRVTCPPGQASKGWHGPYPTSSPTAAPLVVARFTKGQCQPARSASSARNVGFPPREPLDLQVRVRAEQHSPGWQARYAVRSGVEGTISEFVHGHGMRQCRYRGQPKAHPQHVFTAIAVNVERLSGLHRTVTQSRPAADRLPGFPGPAGDPTTEVLEGCEQLASTVTRSPAESS